MAVDLACARFVASMIEVCRANPDGSRVIFRIDNGEWQVAPGGDFLELWDQPFAGTIDIDHVVIDDG